MQISRVLLWKNMGIKPQPPKKVPKNTKKSKWNENEMKIKMKTQIKMKKNPNQKHIKKEIKLEKKFNKNIMPIKQ